MCQKRERIEKWLNCSGSSFQMGEAVFPPIIELPFGGRIGSRYDSGVTEVDVTRLPPPRNDGHPLFRPQL
jgi:hypothetical protein